MRLLTAARLATGAFSPFLRPDWNEKQRRTFRTWVRGERIDDARPVLRHELAECFSVPQEAVVLSSSGRASIRLALWLAGLPINSEVVLPAFSCRGVVQPVVDAGLKPVLVDIDRELNLSFDSVLAAASNEVAAVILPHLFGTWAADASAIISFAKDRGWLVVEDAAQSFGFGSDRSGVGYCGDVVVLSFGPGKPIEATGGGALIVRNDTLIASLESVDLSAEPEGRVKARATSFWRHYMAPPRSIGRQRLREFVTGSSDRTDAGSTAPMQISPLDAAITQQQLGHLSDSVQAQRANAAKWAKLLAPFATEPNWSTAPIERSTCLKYWIVHEGPDADREASIMRKALWRSGVECELLYTPIHMRNDYPTFRRTPTPVTDAVWRATFALPCRPNLARSDWDRIESGVGRAASALGKSW